jgi:hypothetical protein
MTSFLSVGNTCKRKLQSENWSLSAQIVPREWGLRYSTVPCVGNPAGKKHPASSSHTIHAPKLEVNVEVFRNSDVTKARNPTENPSHVRGSYHMHTDTPTSSHPRHPSHTGVIYALPKHFSCVAESHGIPKVQMSMHVPNTSDRHLAPRILPSPPHLSLSPSLPPCPVIFSLVYY